MHFRATGIRHRDDTFGGAYFLWAATREAGGVTDMLLPNLGQRGMEPHDCQRIVRRNIDLFLGRSDATTTKGYDWLAAIRSKSPRSTASSLPVRQLPFTLRTGLIDVGLACRVAAFL